jgi:hypothetical protein
MSLPPPPPAPCPPAFFIFNSQSAPPIPFSEHPQQTSVTAVAAANATAFTVLLANAAKSSCFFRIPRVVQSILISVSLCSIMFDG